MGLSMSTKLERSESAERKSCVISPALQIRWRKRMINAVTWWIILMDLGGGWLIELPFQGFSISVWSSRLSGAYLSAIDRFWWWESTPWTKDQQVSGRQMVRYDIERLRAIYSQKKKVMNREIPRYHQIQTSRSDQRYHWYPPKETRESLNKLCTGKRKYGNILLHQPLSFIGPHPVLALAKKGNRLGKGEKKGAEIKSQPASSREKRREKENGFPTTCCPLPP